MVEIAHPGRLTLMGYKNRRTAVCRLSKNVSAGCDLSFSTHIEKVCYNKGAVHKPLITKVNAHFSGAKTTVSGILRWVSDMIRSVCLHHIIILLGFVSTLPPKR